MPGGGREKAHIASLPLERPGSARERSLAAFPAPAELRLSGKREDWVLDVLNQTESDESAT